MQDSNLGVGAMETDASKAKAHKGKGTIDVSPPIACHGGTQGSLFGLQCK